MNNFSQEEIKNILVLIARANITGQEATSVAILQQKLSGLLENPNTVVKEEKKED